jgi:hypothetical protein
MLSPEERSAMLEEASDAQRRSALRAARLRLYGSLSPADFVTFLTLASTSLGREWAIHCKPLRPGTYRL